MIRHDTAHVLAEAVQSLYPGTQVTIGPSIENGFYYDFARNEPFTPEDFPVIEARMREIIARNAPFVREVSTREQAIAFFEARGERYKAQLIRDLPESETITLYKQGDWIDLCRGPAYARHRRRRQRRSSCMKVAGAYWRGDHRNAMLTPHLRHRLARPEGARRLPAAAGGGGAPRPPPARPRDGSVPYPGRSRRQSIFWHPKGWKLYRTAERLHAPPPGRRGLPGGQAPRNWWTGCCGNAPAIGRSIREHMFVAQVEDEESAPWR